MLDFIFILLAIGTAILFVAALIECMKLNSRPALVTLVGAGLLVLATFSMWIAVHYMKISTFHKFRDFAVGIYIVGFCLFAIGYAVSVIVRVRRKQRDPKSPCE